MIRLTGIQKAYHLGGRPLPVLRDVSLEVNKGDFVAIMGSSGSGKSTLLNVLGILDDYDSGEYWIEGTLIRGREDGHSGVGMRADGLTERSIIGHTTSVSGGQTGP